MGNNKRMHIMVNAFWQMSGGDKRIIEMLRNWRRNDIDNWEYYIYAPQSFLDIIKKENIQNLNYVCTEKEGKRNIIHSYCKRTKNAIKYLSKISTGDIIYSTSDYFPDVIPAIWQKKRDKSIKWISMVHHIIEDYHTRQGNRIVNFLSYILQQISIWLMKNKADVILVVSPLVKKYLANKNIANERIVLVDNGVDISFIDNSQEQCDTIYDAIMLARMVPSKGIFDLPKIWKYVCDVKKDARLAIIGNATDEIKEEFVRLAKEQNVWHNIDLLGYMDSNSAYSYVKNAKVFVFTSREEGWGISLAEAMCCHLPVVAFTLPIYKYIFGDDILYVDNRDKKEFANKILTLLENPDLAEEIATRGDEFVREHYDWKIVAEKEWRVIHNL